LLLFEDGGFQCSEATGCEQPHGGCAPGWPPSAAGGFTDRIWGQMAHHQLQTGCLRHVQRGVTVSFCLQQFSEVLNIRDANGQPFVGTAPAAFRQQMVSCPIL